RVWTDVGHELATSGPTDPANIPRQVRTRHLRRRSRDAGPCLSLPVASRHCQGSVVKKACPHLPGGEYDPANAPSHRPPRSPPPPPAAGVRIPARPLLPPPARAHPPSLLPPHSGPASGAALACVSASWLKDRC